MDKEWDDIINEYQEENGTANEADTPDIDTGDKDDSKVEERADNESGEAEAEEDKKESEEKADSGQKDEGEEPGEADPEKESEGTGKEDADESKSERSVEDIVKETIQSSRAEERNYQSSVDKLKVDIKESLFPDSPKEMTDKDGNPIRSIDDLLEYNNPRTGELFTEEEAASFLLNAQNQFNKQKEEEDKRAEEVAELNYDLMEKIDSIGKDPSFVKLFEADPDKAAQVRDAYRATLEIKNDVVVRAPLDINEFYKLAYSGELKALEGNPPVEDPKEDTPKVDPAQKASSRGDITGASSTETSLGKEDKEWADALKEYYSDR